MKTTSRVFRKSFISAVAFLFTAPFAAQAVTVDGQYNDWDLSDDFFGPMYRAGNSAKDLLSNAYLRYDSNAETVFVLVLEDEGALVPLSASPDNAWVKVYSLGHQTLVSGTSGNEGMAPDFSWVEEDGVVIGWEGSFKLAPGNYGDGFEIHVNHGEETSSTGKKTTAGGEELNTEDLLPLNEPLPPIAIVPPLPEFVPDPKVDIETSTQGLDADDPTGRYIEVGYPVFKLYTVKNTGNVPLKDIKVTGKLGLLPNCDGDNVIDNLSPGETMNCSARSEAIIDLQENLGRAESAFEGFPLVEDEDKSHYFGAEPGLDLQVCTGSEVLEECAEGFAGDHDALPGAILLEDEQVVYTYIATNTGNVPLTNVVVTDDSGLQVDCDGDSIPVGNFITCTAEGITVQGPHENVGQVDAEYIVANDFGDDERRPLQDRDPGAYYALSQEQPSLELMVTEFEVTGSGNQFNNGTFIVENASGDPDVTAVAITKADVIVEYRASTGKGKKTGWIDAGISKNCTTDPAVPFVFEGDGEQSATPGQQEVAFKCTADPDTIPADYSAVRATVCVQIANRYNKVKGKVTTQQKTFCSSSGM